MKVLILFARFGGGHRAVAENIRDYMRRHYPEADVQCVDFMDYISHFVGKAAVWIYLFTTRHTPWIYRRAYRTAAEGEVASVNNGIFSLGLPRIKKLLDTCRPDVVLCTHPFASGLVGTLKRRGQWNGRLYTILTDYTSHPQWMVSKDVQDGYFVAHEIVRDEVIRRYRVPAEKVFVTGIPVSERIGEVEKPAGERPLILFYGGGEYGLGKQHKTMEILEALAGRVGKYDVVAISGKNEERYQAFTRFAERLGDPGLQVIRFTDDVPSFLARASLVVTKPGGITVTECMKAGLPMILYNTVPGQEEYNVDFLLARGIAVHLRDTDSARELISQVLDVPGRLEEMHAACRGAIPPDTLRDITGILLNLSPLRVC